MSRLRDLLYAGTDLTDEWCESFDFDAKRYDYETIDLAVILHLPKLRYRGMLLSVLRGLRWHRRR